MRTEAPGRLGEARLTTTLRKAGLRVTGPRLAVYRALLGLGGHRSGEEIAHHLRADGAVLAKASVYNSLRLLGDLGLVMRADVGAGPVLYEPARQRHHHFVCRRCGRIENVACPDRDCRCLRPTFDGGTVDEADVILRGLCTTCSDRGH